MRRRAALLFITVAERDYASITLQHKLCTMSDTGTPEVQSDKEKKAAEFIERMKAAKEKKAGKPTVSKIVQEPQYFIFRRLFQPSAPLNDINIKFGWKPHVILPTTSSILWPYEVNGAKRTALPLTDDPSVLVDENNFPKTNIRWFPRDIRYIHNSNSPFKDEQDAEFGDTLKRENGFNGILDNPLNRDALQITGWELKVPATEWVLYHYLWLHGMCDNIHPLARRRTQKPVYRLIDFGQVDKEKVDLGKKKHAMYLIARDAKLEEMIPHAKHLGIKFRYEETGEERDLDVIREDYVEMALNDPINFEKTFRDPKIKIMHTIISLHERGELIISAGRARWAHSNSATITLIPPNANPIEFLADFSLGNADFAEQLAAAKVYIQS